MQNQNHSDMQPIQRNIEPAAVPTDVKKYEAPIKRMENESEYQEWLDRRKLVVPAGELSNQTNNPVHAETEDPAFFTERDASITHNLHAMLITNKESFGDDLKVSVREGDVIVTGTVADRQTMEQITGMVGTIQGVRSVINHIRICDGSLDQPQECIKKIADKNEFSSTTSKLLTSAFAGAASLFKSH